VNKDIIAFFTLDEAIALGAAEPLDRTYGSFTHYEYTSFPMML
jgi:hypothetical protein